MEGLSSISTGCSSLDSLLCGGFPCGAVTELVGAAASGKTQLCLQACATASLRHHAAVAFIDSGHSFASQRVAHVIGRLVGTRERLQESRSSVVKALKAVIRLPAADAFSLLSLLSDIAQRKRQAVQPADFFFQLRLLVVDSASAVIAPLLGGRQVQGHAIMMTISRALRRLAVEFNLAVVITNHTVTAGFPVNISIPPSVGISEERGSSSAIVAADRGAGAASCQSSGVKAALGESWRVTASVRILLERGGVHQNLDMKSVRGGGWEDVLPEDCVRATLMRHCQMACGSSTVVRLSKLGFLDT